MSALPRVKFPYRVKWILQAHCPSARKSQPGPVLVLMLSNELLICGASEHFKNYLLFCFWFPEISRMKIRACVFTRLSEWATGLWREFRERVCHSFAFSVYVFSHQVMSDSLWPHELQPASSSVHRISQARILEWVAISFSRQSSQPRDRTPHLLHYRQLLCHLSSFFTIWTRETLMVAPWPTSIGLGWGPGNVQGGPLWENSRNPHNSILICLVLPSKYHR